MFILLHVCVVLMVEFSSKVFNGSESSQEVILNVVVLGGTSTTRFSVRINLSGTSAQGKTVWILTA